MRLTYLAVGFPACDVYLVLSWLVFDISNLLFGIAFVLCWQRIVYSCLLISVIGVLAGHNGKEVFLLFVFLGMEANGGKWGWHGNKFTLVSLASSFNR